MVVPLAVGGNPVEGAVTGIDDAGKMLGAIDVGEVALKAAVPLFGDVNGFLPFFKALQVRYGTICPRPGAGELGDGS